MITQENSTTFDLDKALASFAPDPLQVNVTPSHQGILYNPDALPATEDVETTEEDEELDDEEETVVEEEAAPETSTEFASQFKAAFGIEPQEAVELVNSLQVFRDEQALMRQWGVSPSEYDERMSTVRQFFEKLPEDKRGEFNTVQGAVAIWNHLVETQQIAQKPQKTSALPKSKTGRQPVPTRPKHDFKRSEILRMPQTEYKQKLPQIAKAYREGRVLEDV